MTYKFEQFENEIKEPKVTISARAMIIFETEENDKQAVSFDLSELQTEIELLVNQKLKDFEVE